MKIFGGIMQQIFEKELFGNSEQVTAFELTANVLKRLNSFDLTATAKLVLVFLTTFYNAERNGAVVFPSIPYIADTLGIGLTAAKQAIKDLVLNGLLLKSKLNKAGNHNKYVLSLKVQNPTAKQSENDRFKQTDSDRFMNRTNKQEEIKKQTNNNVVVFQKKQTVMDPDVPDFIKQNKSIKNPCAYWASLTHEIKAELIKKDMEIQAAAQKKEELKLIEAQKRLEERKNKEEYLKKPLSERYTKEQAIALINAMPAEIRKISKIAKELTELYNL